MKAVAILLSMLLLSTAAFAAEWELDKGAVEIGGSFNLSSMGGDLYESGGKPLTIILLTPSVHHFVSPGFSVGGILGYEGRIRGDYSSSVIIIGPVLNYYFADSLANAWPFVGAGILAETYNNSSDYTGRTIHLEGGIACKIVDHYILKVGFYYNIDRKKWDYDDYYNREESESGFVFGLSLGFSGFIY